jgi:hypothetical protein
MPVFLTLGAVTFANFEIPEKINFGGTQALSVKQLVGGQRIIDAMGRVDDDISWSGLFFGATATQRAQFLDQMRCLGAAIPLTFANFSFQVIIKDFKCSFERTYQMPYSITCTVVQNLNLPLQVLLPVGYNDAITNQLTEANDLAFLINNASVLAAMALVSAAIQNIPSLQNATTGALAPVIQSILGAQSAVTSTIGTISTRLFPL